MRKFFVYRLYPSTNQARELDSALETHRRLYNAALGERIDRYAADKTSVGYYQQAKSHTADRKTNTFYAGLNAQSAQATLKRLDRSYASFFRRVKAGAAKKGFPRFKRRDDFHSFSFPQCGKGAKLLANGKLRVFGVGELKVKLHRPLEGVVKTVALKRAGGKWYVFFSCDLGEVAIEPSTLPPVGIDVGLEHFLTTSEGQHVANPRLLKAQLPALRRKQRSLCRKKKGGKNRRKAVREVAKLHRRVACARRDFHFKAAHQLVTRYGLVAVEGLNILGMVRNHRLARSIGDAAWGGFLDVLAWKAVKAGATTVVVDAAYTSQDCSACGVRVQKDLSVRTHRCPCGLVLQRDVNAAKNILARGLARTGPAGLKLDGELSREAPGFGRGSRHLLSDEHAAACEIIDGHGPGDCLSFEDRPRLKRAALPPEG